MSSTKVLVVLFFPYSGDYQRMEFLGDAILQLLTSVYVYQSFPMHHEGHLSVLLITCVFI